MIVYLIEKDYVVSVFLEGEKKDIPLLGEAAYLIQQKGSWSLRLPAVLKKDRNKGSDSSRIIRISHRKTGECAILCFIKCDSEWKMYDRFVMPSQPFTAGSSPSDDLTFISESVAARQYIIDPVKNLVFSGENCSVFINGSCRGTSAEYKAGDRLDMSGLRIIFHPSFIMINRMKNCVHDFEKCLPDPAVLPHQEHPKLVYHMCPSAFPGTQKEFKIDEPQMIPENNTRNVLFSLGPSLMMSSASLSGGIISVWIGYNNGREIIEMVPMILLPSVMIVSALLWNPLQAYAEKRKYRKMIQKRDKEYDRYLNIMIDEIDSFRQQCLEKLNMLCPDEKSLCAQLKDSSRIDVISSENLILRLGTAEDILQVSLNRTQKHPDRADNTEKMYLKFEKQAMRKQKMPYTVSLDTYKRIVIDREGSFFFRRMIIEIAGRYHPDEVGIVLFAQEKMISENMWILDVPHLFADSDIRLIGTTPNEATEILNCCAAEKRKLILFNMLNIRQNSGFFTSEIILADDSFLTSCDLRISKTDTWIADDFILNRTVSFIAEEECDIYPEFVFRLPMRHTDMQIAGSFSFLEMHGCTDVRSLDIEERWKSGNISRSIQSLIGCTPEGEDIILDLHEKRDGPHGLIAGTTGSGKSELILTMILSLAISYSPRDLQFILIDFKGGSSLNSLTNPEHALPHVTGTLSNLDSEDMHRVLVQFSLECRNRENLIRQMSRRSGRPVMNISDYRTLWDSECGLEYIPELVIIADEFAELKKEKPEFLNELISIARIGRSLGIHLILSTQKPAGIVTDQIWSNCRFKICLKAAEKQDSMEMIHTPDAAFIREAGCFWMLSEERLVYGRSGYVQAVSVSSDAGAVIYDTMHRTVSQYGTRSVQEPEITRVIDMIRQIQKDPVKPLWNPRISCVRHDDLSAPFAFALADDYFEDERREIILEASETYAFITPDTNERKKLTMMLCEIILSSAEKDDELIVIDDLACECGGLIREAPVCTDVFPSSDKDRTGSMYALLKNREDRGVLYLIINDLNTHYECSEEYRTKLMKTVQSSTKDHLAIIIMASSAGCFSYRETSLIANRFCLKDTSAQQIAEFLETSCRTSIQKENHGFTMLNRLLEICLLEYSRDHLLAAIELNKECFADKKKRILPHMPDRVLSIECNIPGIPLGILRRNYQWKTAKEKDRICLVCDDPDICAAFEKRMKKYGIRCEDTFPFEARAAIVSPEQLTDFENSRYRGILFLFVQNAFSRQYRVHASVKPAPNESVLYEKNRCEVIVLAEE